MLAFGIILTTIVALAALYVLFSGWELTPFAKGVLVGLFAPVLAFFFYSVYLLEHCREFCGSN